MSNTNEISLCNFCNVNITDLDGDEFIECELCGSLFCRKCIRETDDDFLFCRHCFTENRCKKKKNSPYNPSKYNRKVII